MEGWLGKKQEGEVMKFYEEVNDKLKYENGNLIWREARGSAAKGSIAGSKATHGYLSVGINGKNHYVHRIVWLLHHGYLPENEIDHINRNKADNRIENLREVSTQCNRRNYGTCKKNTSGVKGISWHKDAKKWMPGITINKRGYNLGLYKDFNEAVLARLAAEQCLDWQGCDSSSSAYKYAISHGLVRGVE